MVVFILVVTEESDYLEYARSTAGLSEALIHTSVTDLWNSGGDRDDFVSPTPTMSYFQFRTIRAIMSSWAG